MHADSLRRYSVRSEQRQRPDRLVCPSRLTALGCPGPTRTAGLRAFSLTCRATQRAAEIAAWTFWAAGSCGPATWTAAAASSATSWAWPSTGSSALRRSRGGVLPRPGLAQDLRAHGRPCRAVGDDLDPGTRCPGRARPAGGGGSPHHRAQSGSDEYGRSGSEECLPKRDECAERGEYPNVGGRISPTRRHWDSWGRRRPGR